MTVVGALGSARELLERFETKPDGERKSMAFLIEALKGGPRLASELTAEAEKAGINGRTLRRAFNSARRSAAELLQKPSFRYTPIHACGEGFSIQGGS